MIRRLACVTFVASAILGTCWPLLSGQRIAFRDTSHFYLPLYDYVAERSAAEWLPLWNPLDQAGMPLIGESSTAVLYPLRYALYSLPLPNEWAMNLYLITHLLLASAAAAWLAKRIGCQTIGVCTAAIAYPLSGSVFSLCCNPPFLVGAAWTPWLLGACLATPPDNQARQRLGRPAGIAAIALSMMVLGGDPQSALHCVLVVLAIGVFRFLGQLRRPAGNRSRGGDQESSATSPFARPLVICLAGCVLTLGLAAIQIAASYDWSRQSDRVVDVETRSDVYDFSLAPWHTLELVSPRPFGHPFPINRRIAKLLPGEGRMWTPSLYAGLIVGLALLVRLLRPRSYFTDPWFPLAVVALTLCFGHFGMVWLLQQIPGVMGDRSSAIGGPYWLLLQIIPGYSSFRYPVKWLPMFAIASSMVAAQWVSAAPSRREGIIGIVLGVLLIAAAAIAHWVSLNANGWLDTNRMTIPVDEYWGPLDVVGGATLIRASLLWSTLLILVILVLRWQSSEHSKRSAGSWATASLLVVSMLDCGANASTLLPTVAIDQERDVAHQAGPPRIAKTRTLRTQSGMWPRVWRETGSQDRALEVAASERIAWLGRWHLAERQAVFNSMVSIRSKSYGRFWSVSYKRLAELDRQQANAFWQSTQQWLAIGAVSHVDASETTAARGLSLVHVDRKPTGSIQTIRVVARWNPQAPLEEIMADLGRDRDAFPLPHVDFPPPTSASAGSPSWTKINDAAIELKCDAPCVVERCMFQDGNWTARLVPLDTPNDDQARDGVSISLPVLPSSHLNQAVLVPRGNWRVVFEYRPWWVWPTVLMTVLSMLVTAICLFLPNSTGRLSVRGIVLFWIPGRL